MGLDVTRIEKVAEGETVGGYPEYELIDTIGNEVTYLTLEDNDILEALEEKELTPKQVEFLIGELQAMYFYDERYLEYEVW